MHPYAGRYVHVKSTSFSGYASDVPEISALAPSSYFAAQIAAVDEARDHPASNYSNVDEALSIVPPQQSPFRKALTQQTTAIERARNSRLHRNAPI
jgi:hypothetical protein